MCVEDRFFSPKHTNKANDFRALYETVFSNRCFETHRVALNQCLNRNCGPLPGSDFTDRPLQRVCCDVFEFRF